jgi:hypothetical protein
VGTTTTLLGLYKPDVDEVGWGLLRNSAIDTVDTALGTQHGLTGQHKFVTVDNVTGYIKFPELTTVQRDALPATVGYTIYNTDDDELQSYQAGSWQTVVGSSLTVTETDLGPNIANVVEMRFPNTTVTDLGGGIISVTGFLTDGEGVSVGDIVYFDGSNWSRIAPGLSGQLLETQGVGAAPQWITPGVGGNVNAALSLDDNAIVRGDGGLVGVQTSGILIDDSDNVTGIVNLTTTGTVTHNGVTYTFPAVDGAAGNFLQTNGAGTLIWAAGSVVPTFSDAVFRIQDNGDATKQIAFEAVGITTATTRTITMPDTDVDLGDIAANTTHRTSDGSDHTFIDQSVVSGASPTFDGNNFTGVDANDVDIADAGALYTATEVEGALQENRPLINANTAKVTNANHTGDATGDTALTAQPAIITGKGAATVASGDLVLIADVDDSNNLKQVTAQSIGDLGGGGGATLTEDVNQTTHGFSVGEWLYHNGTIYALADADAASTAESIGVVSAVAGANDFTIQFGGKITGLSGLTAGEAHFLSQTAGAITATAPTATGAVSKPVLIADSTTSGFIFNMRGALNVDSTSFTDSFVDADLTAGVLTVSHNLGRQYVQVQIFDNTDTLVIPDDITLTDANTTTIDLSSFGTLTGTWHYVIMDSGTTTNLVVPVYTQGFSSGDLSGGVLTVTHNLGDQYPLVVVYDDSDNVIQPDEITGTNANTTSIDLGSFTVTGTWRVVISAAGGTTTTNPNSFRTSFVDGDLTAGVLTVTHSMGEKYVDVTVYNNTDNKIMPDDITLTDANNLDIDLTSFGTLTGTWNLVVIK